MALTNADGTPIDAERGAAAAPFASLQEVLCKDAAQQRALGRFAHGDGTAVRITVTALDASRAAIKTETK